MPDSELVAIAESGFVGEKNSQRKNFFSIEKRLVSSPR
jgi:hypothetical protein